MGEPFLPFCCYYLSVKALLKFRNNANVRK